MISLKTPSHPEIDHHTMKLIVGLMALSLASLTSYFSQLPLESISASYHEGGWSRNIFVGFLFAISAFLLAYNGGSTLEMVLSKVAAFAAQGVAMFPCFCGGYEEIIPHVHYVSAAIMFFILAFFCYSFYKRASEKGHMQAMARAYIYALCGSVILLSMAILALDSALDNAISVSIHRLTFYGEASGLVAFGIAWLTASRTLPVITSTEERMSLSPFKKKR